MSDKLRMWLLGASASVFDVTGQAIYRSLQQRLAQVAPSDEPAPFRWSSEILHSTRKEALEAQRTASGAVASRP